MFTSFLSFLILVGLSTAVIVIFLYKCFKKIFNEILAIKESIFAYTTEVKYIRKIVQSGFDVLSMSDNELKNNTSSLNDKLQKLLDELEKNDETKILNEEDEKEREERWDRIRKAFIVKEKE